MRYLGNADIKTNGSYVKRSTIRFYLKAETRPIIAHKLVMANTSTQVGPGQYYSILTANSKRSTHP